MDLATQNRENISGIHLKGSNNLLSSNLVGLGAGAVNGERFLGTDTLILLHFLQITTYF